MAVLIEHRHAQAIEAEAAAALPADGLGYAALLALDDLLQPRHTVGHGVVAHLDADVAPPHLVGDGCGRA
jgi:hypothetical protein